MSDAVKEIRLREDFQTPTINIFVLLHTHRSMFISSDYSDVGIGAFLSSHTKVFIWVSNTLLSDLLSLMMASSPKMQLQYIIYMMYLIRNVIMPQIHTHTHNHIIGAAGRPWDALEGEWAEQDVCDLRRACAQVDHHDDDASMIVMMIFVMMIFVMMMMVISSQSTCSGWS